MTEIELLTPTKIVKTKRKSIAIIIENNGDLIIRAPYRVFDSEIYKFILNKKDWIIKKRLEILIKPKRELSLIDGAKIVLLNREFTIYIKNVSKTKVVEDTIILPQENTSAHLIKYLKRELLDIVTKAVNETCEKFGFKYKTISISSAKTNWGSCSQDNKLHFSYRLMFTNDEIIRYIAIHELVHTKIKNHGRKFWEIVCVCCPKYKLYNKWLKDNREIMDLI